MGLYRVKILIADDNLENVVLVRDLLDATVYEIVEAYDGIEALELARQELPDLILLDVSMPEMSGLEVCRNLKQDVTTADIPIIMITALSDVDNRVAGLKAGADDYLGKPFSPRELVARVERSLRAKSQTDDLRSMQLVLRKTFERFVAAPIVEQLLKNPGLVQLGGQLQPVTVMFADLEGFTAVSETLDPASVIQLLNQYHSFIVKIVLQYGGTIDKFLGDGLMCLYNTPVPQEDHVARAVKTALHIQDELYWLHHQLPDELQHMRINFGIHTGLAVVGNVGSDNIMDFTAVGDTINVAARLQSVAEDGQILVSRAVYEMSEEFVFGRSRGGFRVRGRQQPIETYQISNTYFD